MIKTVWLWEDDEILHSVEVEAESREEAIQDALAKLSAGKIEFDLDGRFRVDVIEGDETLQLNPVTGQWDKIQITHQAQLVDGRWE